MAPFPADTSGTLIMLSRPDADRLPMLTHIALAGFRSIAAMDLELGRMNVLIGANGAGKSNLVAFFKLLNEMLAGRLQQHIAVTGRAQSLLHFGPKTTPQLEARLTFATDQGENRYEMRLFHAAGDTLIFADETLRFQRAGIARAQMQSLGAGHAETRIREAADGNDTMARVFRHLLSHCRVYHFHDTSPSARVRQFGYVGDNRWLMPDAGNLAAFLYRLKGEDGGAAYRRILGAIRLIAPFFDDFELAPAGAPDITLNWRQRESDQVFGPHQLSDGTLRAICLVTLLSQPAAMLPDLIVIDEPELGLHPYALSIIAGLLGQAATRAQVIVSTQSSSLLSEFDPADVIVADRQGRASVFSRPDPERLAAWLEDYSLGEIWEKNIFGGGPQ